MEQVVVQRLAIVENVMTVMNGVILIPEVPRAVMIVWLMALVKEGVSGGISCSRLLPSLSRLAAGKFG